MYADPQFIACVKQGYEEGLAEQGMSLEEYARARFLQDLQVKVDRAREALATGNTISVYDLDDELDDEIGPTT